MSWFAEGGVFSTFCFYFLRMITNSHEVDDLLNGSLLTCAVATSILCGIDAREPLVSLFGGKRQTPLSPHFFQSAASCYLEIGLV